MNSSIKTLIFVMAGSAVLAAVLSGRTEISPAPSGSPAAQQKMTDAPMVIVTRSWHPGFKPVQLDQGTICLVRMGDGEQKVRAALGNPVEVHQGMRIFKVHSVRYDWDTDGKTTEKFLGVNIGPDNTVEGLMPLSPGMH